MGPLMLLGKSYLEFDNVKIVKCFGKFVLVEVHP